MCTVSASNKRMGNTWPVTFGLHRVVLEDVDEDNDVTSLVARHISGAAEIIAAANKRRAPVRTRLLRAIGQGAGKEVRQRFYE